MDEISTLTQVLPETIASMSLWGVTKLWLYANATTILNGLFYALLIPIFGPMLTYFTLWVKSEFEQKMFTNSLNNVKELVKLTVTESNQKYVTKFPGGTDLPKEVKEKAFKEAFDKTKLYMSALDKSNLSSRISDLDSFISSLIEAEVLVQAHVIDFKKVS